MNLVTTQNTTHSLHSALQHEVFIHKVHAGAPHGGITNKTCKRTLLINKCTTLCWATLRAVLSTLATLRKRNRQGSLMRPWMKSPFFQTSEWAFDFNWRTGQGARGIPNQAVLVKVWSWWILAVLVLQGWKKWWTFLSREGSCLPGDNVFSSGSSPAITDNYPCRGVVCPLRPVIA